MKVVSASEDDLLPTSALQMTYVINAEEEEDKSDDKQPKWLPKRDQDKRSEARRSGEFQIPWSNHLQRRIKTPDSFQDSPDNSISF